MWTKNPHGHSGSLWSMFNMSCIKTWRQMCVKSVFSKRAVICNRRVNVSIDISSHINLYDDDDDCLALK